MNSLIVAKYVVAYTNDFIAFLDNSRNRCTFVSTVLATLPVRSAYQGESFAFYKVLN